MRNQVHIEQFCLLPKYTVCLKKKACVNELQAEHNIFLTEQHFDLKRTDTILLFIPRYLKGIFLKMNKVGLFLWGKQSIIFVAMIKSELSKIELWKTCIIMSLIAF